MRGLARSTRANAHEHSCRQITSASAYASPSSTLSVRSDLVVTSASQMLILSSCHAPGASVLSTWTSVASKIAQHSSWSGTEIASSSSVMAGYLAFLIGGSIVHGSLGAAAPDLSLMSS